MTIETIWVTIAPPTLSAIFPPTGRINAPINAPTQANINVAGPSGFATCCQTPSAPRICFTPKINLIDRPTAAEYPMNDPKVIVYMMVITQVCLLLKILN